MQLLRSVGCDALVGDEPAEQCLRGGRIAVEGDGYGVEPTYASSEQTVQLSSARLSSLRPTRPIAARSSSSKRSRSSTMPQVRMRAWVAIWSSRRSHRRSANGAHTLIGAFSSGRCRLPAAIAEPITWTSVWRAPSPGSVTASASFSGRKSSAEVAWAATAGALARASSGSVWSAASAKLKRQKRSRCCSQHHWK